MADPQRVRSIFLEAVEHHAPDQWSAFLNRACGAEPHLRQRVEVLLRAHDQANSMLDVAAVPPVATIDRPAAETAGMVIGPFKLIEQIGEGGMGTVWMAQQTEPVKRLVALKLIKAGMDSKQVIARFEAERQALALMDHPNIARMLDGGTTEAGRPYFVMDLVKGVPITRYCDEHHLTPRRRLELFIPVCQAVQHAHQKGIIHRDLKPSNVLVALYDGKPVPKVIDFGVAKAAGQPLTDKTLVTGFGNIVGTLEYMSPEQAEINQLDIDTRSDIYSLGVLLYELVAGSPPFSKKDLEKAGMLEMLRVIREDEPSKPSTKLSSSDALPTLSANRGTEPAKLTRLVRGELDWIVMKALEKDRSRRYDTANGLARDVERYLADEPVQACPPSVVYRLRKFARRNKATLAVAALFLFILMLLGGGAGWMLRDHEARRTRLAAQLGLILNEVHQRQAEEIWLEALAAARRAEALLAGGGGADQALQRQVQEVIAGLELVKRLDTIRADKANQNEDRMGWTDRAYADAFREFGIDFDRITADEAAERFRMLAALTVPLVAAMDDWHFCRIWTGKTTGAEAIAAVVQRIDPDPSRRKVREALTRKDGKALVALAAGPDLFRQTPTTLSLIADAMCSQGQLDQGITVLRKAQRLHPTNFFINGGLAMRLRQRGPAHLYEATSFNRAATALRPDSATAWINLGVVLRDTKQLDEAIVCIEKAIEINPKEAWAYYNLGVFRLDQKKYDEAFTGFTRAVRLNPKLALAHDGLGVVLFAQQKPDEAIASYRKAIECDAKCAEAHRHLGNALLAQKKHDDAMHHYRQAALQVAPNEPFAHENLASALCLQKKWDEGIAHYRKAIANGQASANAHYSLGVALASKGATKEAIECWERMLEVYPNDVTAYKDLSWFLSVAADPQVRDPHSAVFYARRAVRLAPNDKWSWRNLGVALLRAGDFKASVEALEQADRLWQDSAGFHRFFLAMAYWHRGDKDKARQTYEQGVQWMEKNLPNDDNLRRFRTEAEQLLKINDKTNQSQKN